MRVDPKHQGGHEVVYGVLSASACPGSDLQTV